MFRSQRLSVKPVVLCVATNIRIKTAFTKLANAVFAATNFSFSFSQFSNAFFKDKILPIKYLRPFFTDAVNG